MKNLSPNRATQLLDVFPWTEGARVRVVWIQVAEGSRSEFADCIASNGAPDAVVPIIVRDSLFQSANAVLSDLNQLIEKNKGAFDSVSRHASLRLTVVVLSKGSFSLPQIASPIVMPRWFPVLGGQETFLRICDLVREAEVALLNCPESRVDLISELVYELEREMVACAGQAFRARPKELDDFLGLIFEAREKRPQTGEVLAGFQRHLEAVGDPRAYRISARLGMSLAGRLVRLAVRSSPDHLGSLAKALAACFGCAKTSEPVLNFVCEA